MTGVTEEQIGRVRGSVLGLMLGDTLGGSGIPPHGPMLATCAGQLACFTIEGMIRAHVRYSHKGICHPPSVVWRAYQRWATLQGISGVKRWDDGARPNGWLAEVPVLAQRRGSAPATVQALQQQTMGTLDQPASGSVGAHGLTRSLPAGLIHPWYREPGRFAAEIAASTHATEAAVAASAGATIVAGLTQGLRIETAAAEALRQCSVHLPTVSTLPVETVVAHAHSTPREPSILSHLAAEARATSAPRPGRSWARPTALTRCRSSGSPGWSWPGSPTRSPVIWSGSTSTVPPAPSTRRPPTRTGGTATRADSPTARPVRRGAFRRPRRRSSGRPSRGWSTDPPPCHNRRVSDTAVAARLITAAARDHLQPLGLQRLGPTRFWLDDRSWWIINVEFQPSRGRAGTYLNVGAMWLWKDQDHWSFDEGSRLYWRDDGSLTSTVPLGEIGWTTFLDFRNVEQFSRDITMVADIAARRVAELRAQFPDPRSVADHLTSRTTRLDESPWWHAYHRGAAAGLAGDTATAKASFDRITPGNLAVEWEHELARTAAELSELTHDARALRQHLGGMISTTRQRLKLPPVSLAQPLLDC